MRLPNYIGLALAMAFLAGARVAFQSPTKELAGLGFLLVAMIILALGTRGLTRNEWLGQVYRAAKMCLPILLLVGYAYLLALIEPTRSPSVGSFTLWMFMGLCCFVTASAVFANTGKLPYHVVILILLSPGILQLLVYGYDIFSAYMHGEILHAENLKDIPRVGKKFVSLALAELLFLSLITINIWSWRGYSILSLFLISISLVAIASLDARAEYFALVIVLIVVISISSIRKLGHNSFSRLTPNPVLSYVFLGAIVAVTAIVAGEAGSQRWEQFSTSISAALSQGHEVKVTKSISPALSQGHGVKVTKDGDNEIKKWASPEYWETHEDNDRFRYTVDSSAYLRVSWIKYGLTKFVSAPLGIGVNQYPLQELLNQDFPELKAKGELYKKAEFHSALLDMAVSLGVPGLLLMGWFFFRVIANAYFVLRSNPENLIVLAVGLILVGCLARLVVDGLNGGWWYYMMGVAGTLGGVSYEGRAPELIGSFQLGDRCA